MYNKHMCNMYDDFSLLPADAGTSYWGDFSVPLFGTGNHGVNGSDELYIDGNQGGFGGTMYGHWSTVAQRVWELDYYPVFRASFQQYSVATASWEFRLGWNAITGSQYTNDCFGLLGGGGSTYYQAQSKIGGAVQSTQTFSTACDTNWHEIEVHSLGPSGDCLCILDRTDIVTLPNAGLYTGDFCFGMTFANSTTTNRGIKVRWWQVMQRLET